MSDEADASRIDPRGIRRAVAAPAILVGTHPWLFMGVIACTTVVYFATLNLIAMLVVLVPLHLVACEIYRRDPDYPEVILAQWRQMGGKGLSLPRWRRYGV